MLKRVQHACRWGIAAATLGVVMTGAAPALAANVKVVHVVGEGNVLHYDAASGEINNLTFTAQGTLGSIVVHDAGAVVHAGNRCRSLTRHTAICAAAPAEIALGARDDRVQLIGDSGFGTDRSPFDVTVNGGGGSDRIDGTKKTFEPISAAGGRGRDTILGSVLDDSLAGGAGADVIRAGLGLDEVSGGDGGDKLYVRNNDTDYVICGGGFDTVTADANESYAPAGPDNLCDRILLP